MMSGNLLKNSLIYGIAPQVTRVFSILILPFITPYLTRVDYGIAGVVGAVVAGINVFSTLGLAYILMVYFYKSPCQYKWIWRQIYGFIRIWQLFFIVLQSLILYFFVPPEANEYYLLICGILALPYIFFSGSSFIGYNLFRFKQNAWGVGIRSMIGGLSVVVINLITIRFYHLGYLGWFISMAISDVLVNASYYFPLKFKHKLSPIYFFKRKTIFKSLKSSFPLLPHYYSIYLLDTSDRLVMKILQIPTALIGGYNLASNFGSYFSAFHMAVGQAIGPSIFSDLKQSNHSDVKKITHYYFGATLLLTFTFSCWSKEVFFILFRNQELQGFYLLSIGIVMAYNYRPYYVLVNQYLSFFEKVRFLPYITFVPGALNVLLNIILIPKIGIHAAVIVTFVCYSIMGFAPFLLPFVKKIINGQYYVLIAFAYVLFLTILAYFSVDKNVWIKIFCYCIGVVAIYILFRRNTNENISI